MDALEDVEWPGLVVDRVEGGDEIERLRLGRPVEGGEIALRELDVAQAFLRGFAACVADRLRREVEAGKAAAWVELSQPDHSAAASATDIKHADALREPVG